jgi:FkbM family methyltransferase
MIKATNVPVGGLRSVLKLAIARSLTSDFFGRLIKFLCADRISHAGSRISVGERRYRTAAMIFWNLYESAEIRFVKKYWRNDMSTIELGSSVGVVSSYLGRRLSPSKKLICVEGNPELVPVLTDNVERNTQGAKVEIVNMAVHYDAPVISFEIGSTNLTSRVLSGSGEKATGVVDVRSISLETLVRMVEEPFFQIVCDIEGAEVGLILNDGASLAACATLIIETHETRHHGVEYDTESIIELIHSNTPLRLEDRYGPVCVFLNGSLAE